MNKEFLEALDILEKEKGISRDAILNAVEISLKKACEDMYDTSENIRVNIDRETGDFGIYQARKVVESLSDPKQKNLEITLEEAKQIDPNAEIGGTVEIEIQSKSFGRIAAQHAKSIIFQKIHEEERLGINEFFQSHLHEVMTGTVSRVNNGVVSINLGKADAVLLRENMIPGESFRPQQHIKVYIASMKGGAKGARVELSRTKANMVKKLFESEVSEIRDGIVEIKAISREPGSRVKMAVWSNDENVDPIGSCIGVNGSRINPIVDELHGEKIDIVKWDENPARFVENALSPAKVVAVAADEDEKTALVVVPDNQLSLAIGMKGQNARLAAKLTGYKIDIKSETEAHEEGLFDDDYSEEEYAEPAEGAEDEAPEAEGADNGSAEPEEERQE